jgi:hypothetical protein
MRVGTVAFRAISLTILPSSSNSELLDFGFCLADGVFHYDRGGAGEIKRGDDFFMGLFG